MNSSLSSVRLITEQSSSKKTLLKKNMVMKTNDVNATSTINHSKTASKRKLNTISNDEASHGQTTESDTTHTTSSSESNHINNKTDSIQKTKKKKTVAFQIDNTISTTNLRAPGDELDLDAQSDSTDLNRNNLSFNEALKNLRQQAFCDRSDSNEHGWINNYANILDISFWGVKYTRRDRNNNQLLEHYKANSTLRITNEQDRQLIPSNNVVPTFDILSDLIQQIHVQLKKQMVARYDFEMILFQYKHLLSNQILKIRVINMDWIHDSHLPQTNEFHIDQITYDKLKHKLLFSQTKQYLLPNEGYLSEQLVESSDIIENEHGNAKIQIEIPTLHFMNDNQQFDVERYWSYDNIDLKTYNVEASLYSFYYSANRFLFKDGNAFNFKMSNIIIIPNHLFDQSISWPFCKYVEIHRKYQYRRHKSNQIKENKKSFKITGTSMIHILQLAAKVVEYCIANNPQI